MNAPPSTLSTSNVSGSIETRLTPLSSARIAIAGGMIASNVTGDGGRAAEPDGRSSMNASIERQVVHQFHNLHPTDLFERGRHKVSHQPAPAATTRPTICTAMTFTIVIDGKIIAYPISGRSVGAMRVE